MPLIQGFEERYLLDLPAMDRSHREFVDLVNRMAESTNGVFAYLYPELVQHTHAHFAAEEVLMQQTGFAATAEHKDEHRRVLAEMEWFGQRLAKGQMGLVRAYIQDQMPQWFGQHAVTMDSALAAHVKRAIEPSEAGLT